jgi:hypothetical protein
MSVILEDEGWQRSGHLASVTGLRSSGKSSLLAQKAREKWGTRRMPSKINGFGLATRAGNQQ